MQKIYSRIDSIAGNVITVTAQDVRYGELAEIGSAHGDSLAQVIRLDEGTRCPCRCSPARGASPPATRCASSATRCRCPSPTTCWAASSTAAGSPRDKGPAHHREPDRDRRPVGQPGQAHHPAQHDPHRHPDDRRVQLPGRVPEAADLLRVRRAVQRAAGPHRHAGRGRHHHPGRHGPEVRRLPVLPRHPRGGRGLQPHHLVRPHGRRPGGRVPAGAGPLPGRGRALRPQGASGCWCCSPT